MYIVQVFTRGGHRSCRLCMTRGYDDESSCTHTKRWTERPIS